MKAERSQYPLKIMAKVLNVSRSGFHVWLKRPPSKHQQEDERLKIAIRAAHEKTRRTYSAKRLHIELQEEGWLTGRDRVVRLRREMGLSCKQRRHFKVTAQSDHDFPVASNILEQQFVAERSDTVWHVDITYIPNHRRLALSRRR